MRVLLDTNALLWLLYKPERVPEKASKIFLEADEVFYSVISLWEIGLKFSKESFPDLPILPDWEKDMAAELEVQNFKMLTIGLNHCRMIQDLPFHHRDPFDRMIIAQALEEGVAVMTSDRHFVEYGVEVIW